MSTSIYMIVRVDLTNDEVSEVFNPNSSTSVEDILHHNMENGEDYEVIGFTREFLYTDKFSVTDE